MDQLTISLVVTAALLDSINPCVFGVLIFLLGFLLSVFKKPYKMLMAGLIYALVVYITYFLLGFGILLAVVGTGVTKIVYWIAAIIAIIAGIIEIKDFFAYGQVFSLSIPKFAAKRIETYVKSIKKLAGKNVFFAYGMAAFLGLFVPLVELPCTGAPYFAILALIARDAYLKAIPLLLLYNLIFIAPLLVVIGIVYFGKSSKNIEKWRKRNSGLMRLLIGLFLLALGGYMIYSVLQI